MSRYKSKPVRELNNRQSLQPATANLLIDIEITLASVT